MCSQFIMCMPCMNNTVLNWVAGCGLYAMNVGVVMRSNIHSLNVCDLLIYHISISIIQRSVSYDTAEY